MCFSRGEGVVCVPALTLPSLWGPAVLVRMLLLEGDDVVSMGGELAPTRILAFLPRQNRQANGQ